MLKKRGELSRALFSPWNQGSGGQIRTLPSRFCHISGHFLQHVFVTRAKGYLSTPTRNKRASTHSGATSWLILLLGAFLANSSLAQDKWNLAPRRTTYLEVAGGVSYFKPILRDNHWYQDRFPYDHNMRSGAWRIGLGQKLNERDSFTLSWLDLGTNGVVSDVIPDDPAYSRCLVGDQSENGCAHFRAIFHIKARARGPEFAFTRSFGAPYVRAGALLWLHNMRLRFDLPADHESWGDYHEHGWRIAPMVGGGLRYEWLFVELSYYHALGGRGGFPIAKRAIVPMVGVRAEF